MTGQPHYHRPSAPSFSPLDEEREESMADEGGSAGAEMEAEDTLPGDSLIAVPHVTSREEDAEEGPSEESPPSEAELIEVLKDAALFLGLVVAAGFYLSERISRRKRAKLRLVSSEPTGRSS